MNTAETKKLNFPLSKKEAEKEGRVYDSKTNYNAYFPSLLRELRKEMGVSQAILAGKIGVTKSTVGLYETGDNVPDVKTLYKLAIYYGRSADYLLGLPEEDSNEKRQQKEQFQFDGIFNYIKELPFDERKEFYFILDGLVRTHRQLNCRETIKKGLIRFLDSLVHAVSQATSNFTQFLPTDEFTKNVMLVNILTREQRCRMDFDGLHRHLEDAVREIKVDKNESLSGDSVGVSFEPLRDGTKEKDGDSNA